MDSKQYLVRTKDLKAGMVIAQTIVSEKGQILLEQGSTLTDNLIKDIINWQISYVSIARPPKNSYSDPYFSKIYQETLDLISSTFEKVRTVRGLQIEECKELVENYIELMIDIVGVVDNLYRVRSHHEYTFRHSLNVAILTGLLGKWLGFTGRRLKNLILSGLLHDVGKVFIPPKILDKPGQLTSKERELMKKHPMYSYKLLANILEVPEEVRLGVLQHHEREDGSGYPTGLHRGDINIYAKVVAIADMYDAMTTERVYRKKMPPFAAIDIILGQMYDKLDPAICLTFSANLRRCLVGMPVLLSDGNKGKVVFLTDIATARLVVRLEDDTLIDLEENREIEIVAVLEEENTPCFLLYPVQENCRQ
jgi:HD-GYP domain-containing protein (c-di-GMP phosphodiesterase class II)